ncbi:MAG: outer membrane scaffolding protein for murein synthesis (MipA/OmpV family) [Alphaproteobacteria bacterium]|jgi:outer membrane scaffolding protein for murein synthesis (MipA/OmpV family)
MKKSAHHLVSIFTLGLLTLHSTNLWANTEQTQDDLSGGFFKIGLGYKFDQNPYEEEQNGLALFLSGRYQMENGLFVEASFGANKHREGLNIGYNFYNTPNWNFDVTTVQAFGSTTIGGTLVDPDDVVEPFTVIEDRDSSEMLGLRATGNFGDTNMQLLVAPVLLGDDYDDGVYSSLWVGHSWQVKNWEIYASTGIEYRSQEIIANYFEPSVALQSVGFPTYNASSGFDFTLQVNASYPITQNILFESYVRYTDIADSITDSPIIRITSQIPGRNEAKTEVGVLFSYVF